MASTLALLRRLAEAKADFVLVGGMAAIVHGSASVTDEGIIDFLGEVLAVGAFQQVAGRAVTVDLGGFTCRVIGLEDLLACKRALGRPKGLRVALELEAVLRRRGPQT